MVHPEAGQCIGAHSKQKGGKVGNADAIVTLHDLRAKTPPARLVHPREVLRRDKAADHQEHLHHHPRRIPEPPQQHRRQRVGLIGERTVKSEVMPDEQVRRQCPQHVDELQPAASDGRRDRASGMGHIGETFATAA